MRVHLIGFMCFVAVSSAKAGPLEVTPTPFGTGNNFGFRYDVREPALKAGLTIKSLTLNSSVLTSRVGKDNPSATTLQAELIPNPLLTPPPDCTKTPAECILVPAITGGVDPNNLKTALNQFFLDQNSSSLTSDKDKYIPGDPANKKAPIAGSTQRTDTVGMVFDASPPLSFFPTKIAGQNVGALTF